MLSRVPVWRSEGSAFVHCVYEYRNLDNVHSGERSQKITFDFVSAEAGILRQARAIPGHRYRIEAWGKHVRSESPVELAMGLDLTGGGDWQAATVTWHPWDDTGEDLWVHTQMTVRATGTSLTIFLKGYHQFAAQGVRRCSTTCACSTWVRRRGSKTAEGAIGRRA